jgi:hypothetical protein
MVQKYHAFLHFSPENVLEHTVSRLVVSVPVSRLAAVAGADFFEQDAELVAHCLVAFAVVAGNDFVALAVDEVAQQQFLGDCDVDVCFHLTAPANSRSPLVAPVTANTQSPAAARS